MSFVLTPTEDIVMTIQQIKPNLSKFYRYFLIDFFVRTFLAFH